MDRRTFLGGLAASTCTTSVATVKDFSAYPSTTIRFPAQIKAFDIDFNWVDGGFAPPGHWASADPEKHIRWYESLGANIVQTFAVSCNGYAWYKNGLVPPQPGLEHDFLSEMVSRGHKRGMLVMGYFCVGANSKWGKDHPHLSYGTPFTRHIPFIDQYLDYLCLSIEDAMRKTGIDGYMIDWVWNPSAELREAGWLSAEQELFGQLTGQPFPKSGRPDDDQILTYEREAIDRCWERIRETRDRVNPHCVIWLSCSDFMNPTLAQSRMLKEVDWAMNESPDMNLYQAGKLMVGSHTHMIQNVVGWAGHDAEKFLADPVNRTLDMYGFARPGASSLLPPIEEYLSRRQRVSPEVIARVLTIETLLHWPASIGDRCLIEISVFLRVHRQSNSSAGDSASPHQRQALL